MKRTCIKDLTEKELAGWLKRAGQPGFRVGQIHQWLYEKGVAEFADMRNLPKPLRERLAADFACCSLAEVERLSADDGTRKFLLELSDGETIESVLIAAPDRNTVCVSTQVGCPVRCAFCASGRDGLVRNLTAAEIIDQVLLAGRVLGRRVDNVVLMGIGEPLLNLDAVVPALETLGDETGVGLSARRITVSTSGIVPGIRRLAACAPPWNLALSLHAPTDAGRAELVPSEYRYPLGEIFAACRAYAKSANRKITLEYALIKGKNDTQQAAEAVAKIANDLHAKVNLIPHNPVGSGHNAPGGERVQAFRGILARASVQVTVRREKGAGVHAACGQLRTARD